MLHVNVCQIFKVCQSISKGSSELCLGMPYFLKLATDSGCYPQILERWHFKRIGKNVSASLLANAQSIFPVEPTWGFASLDPTMGLRGPHGSHLATSGIHGALTFFPSPLKNPK